MTSSRILRPTGALALALIVAAATALAGLAPPAFADEEDPAWKSFVDVAPDYLVDTYDLPADHVFETVTFERFEWLLNGVYDDHTTAITGTFAFLVGGAYDGSITATIGYIDEVAKEYGVETIYTFDPALDGNTLNIWDLSEANLHEQGAAQFQALGDRLIDDYLNQSPAPAFDGTSSDPYLFVYDKNHTVDVEGVPTEERIVASLNVRRTAAELATPGDVTAYKAEVAAVFDAVAVEGVAQLDTLDQWTFWKNETNRRHQVQYTNPETQGHTILEDSDADEDWRLQTITYPELLHLLEQEGDYAILFGGTWCHNTRAVLKQINLRAQEHGIEKIYVFDNSLDSTGNAGTNYRHIRDNASPADETGLARRPSHLYGDVWNTYFPNIVTQYRIHADEDWAGSVSPVRFHPGGDHTQPEQLARKGQVPFLLHYNKDNIAGSSPAPVVSQWIRTNDESTSPATGWTEYMISWFHTPTAGPLSGNTNQLAFAAAAEEALHTFFGGLPGAFEVTEVSVSAENAGAGAVTLTATVYWCDSIALDAAGTVEFFRVEEGDDVSLGATTSFADGQASITVSDWGLGVRQYYAVYTPSEGSDYSTATSPIEVFSIEPVGTTLVADATSAFATATLTATVEHDGAVAPAATGTVEFFTPGAPATSLGTADVAAGVASLTLTDLAPGDLAYYAVYTPAAGSIYLGSTSLTQTVTVPGLPSPPPFGDIAGNTHEDNINLVASLGIAQGTTPTTFNPIGNVSRAQTATFLARTLQVAGVALPAEPTATFPDIAGNTHELAIRQLADLGIVQGTADGRFNTSAPVSRAQVATFLVRTIDLVLEETQPAATSPFTDIAGNTHEANINVVHSLGIANGVTATTFNPAGHVRRDQLASFLARTLELFEDEGITLTPLP